MRAGLSVDQLHIDLHLLANPSYTAFEHIADAEIAADLFGVDGFTLIGEGAGA